MSQSLAGEVVDLHCGEVSFLGHTVDTANGKISHARAVADTFV